MRPKNSTLSLTSSVYFTRMPLRSWKRSRVGRTFSFSSSTSMYSGQLEKASSFSCFE